ncbi:peptidoglycan-binding domain-containing protein [Ruegeria hyattellae]|uniref:peptidoglycan-binding domain-containing protein n=1 Tax=Ruegeria hyattellae TaxID=3233337 RepID=UPI00355B7074
MASGTKPKVKINATFDALTEESVKAFQSKKRLKVDGIVGKKTLPKLMKAAKAPKIDLKLSTPD